MRFESVGQILDFAIKQEEAAAALYESLAETVTRPGMRDALLEFAQEEHRHKARLEKIKAGELPPLPTEEVRTLEISESTLPQTPSPGMTYAEVLRLAMHAEKAAFQLYTKLAALAGSDLSGVFHSLAMEEARHKLRFEIEYDDHVLEGN